MIKKRESKFSAVVFLCFILNTLYFNPNSSLAQTATSSPYSRYGIGDINNKNYAQGLSMGGASVALQSDSLPMFFINPSNPASFSSLGLTTADLGIKYNRVQLQNESSKSIINNASLGYISLGFPLKKWWGTSIGLIPYSSVGYKVTDHQEIANVGGVDFLYDGTGGINQLYWGNGIKPLYGLPKRFLKSKKYQQLKLEKNTAEINRLLKRNRRWQALSVGFDVSYLFGNIEHTRRSIFPSSYYAFNTKTGTTTHISDVYFDYGVQYAFTIDSLKGRDLKENVKIMLGATFSAQTNINAHIDSLSVNYFTNSSGYEIAKDTLTLSQNTAGKITFPLSFAIGAGFKKGDKWLVTADFAMQNWSSYQAFNQTGGLKNSMHISLGTQFVPNTKSTGAENYYKRVNYRLGIRYAKTALELKNTQLNEYALSAGFGFPVGRNYLLQNFSMVNIGAEFGQRGTTTDGLIKENFIKVTIGFTINDRWFIKPKFD